MITKKETWSLIMESLIRSEILILNKSLNFNCAYFVVTDFAIPKPFNSIHFNLCPLSRKLRRVSRFFVCIYDNVMRPYLAPQVTYQWMSTKKGKVTFSPKRIICSSKYRTCIQITTVKHLPNCFI